MAKARKKNEGVTSPGEALRKKGAKWLERVEAAGKVEKNWLDDAKKAVEAYTGEGRSENGGPLASSAGQYDFNILFSNVETIVPAVINSAPVPDIRRRFADPDPTARIVADIMERAIRVQIDDSRLQVEMEAAAQDSFLAGRGIVRIRYMSDIVGGEPTNEEIEDAAETATAGGLDAVHRAEGDDGPVGEADNDPGEDVSGLGQVSGFGTGGIGDNGGPPLESIANERIGFEAVSWIDYRHGPAKRWDDRPWDAFRFCIPREDESKSFDTTMIGEQLTDRDLAKRATGEDELCGWEIWDKATRTVIFIDDAGVVLKTITDPLGLHNFFCIPTPMQPIEINGRLMPVNPFATYRTLANDLDDAVRRKNVLIKAMKAKGWYGTSEKDLNAVLDLEDNEFAPISDPEIWAQNGGIEKAIAFWPIERFIIAIQQLDSAINTYKQWIYEITGISDIVRGASNPGETATAQGIKNQWGSLRIQKMQRMMERCARDLFVMMAEIIPAKFTPKTLEEMTGIPILPLPTDTPEQTQQKVQVTALLKRKLSSYYRIDVESDSTVRADLTRQKQEVSEFLQASSSYFQAVAPLVQQGAMPADAAIDIFASTARMFNLGKSVEDTLEKMVTAAKDQAQQPKQEKPDPEMAKAQMEQQKVQAQAQIAGAKAQSDQAMAQVQIETIQTKLRADLAKIEADIKSKQIDADISIAETNQKLAADQQTHALDMQKGELELVKIQAEIEKIRAGTAATVVSANARQAAPVANEGFPA